MPQRGTLLIFLGVPFILAGILALKFTGMDASWALIALGGAISSTGGIQVSLSQNTVPYAKKSSAP